MPNTDKSIRHAGQDPDLDSLCQMVRSMLAMSRPVPPEANPVVGSPNRVVIDVEVDGSRYLLIKTLPMDHRGAALSPREREIVRMVALGHPNKVIAAVLNISMWTVCTHLRRIFSKLDVTSRAAMVAKVTDLGAERAAPLERRRAHSEASPSPAPSRREASGIEF